MIRSVGFYRKIIIFNGRKDTKPGLPQTQCQAATT